MKRIDILTGVKNEENASKQIERLVKNDEAFLKSKIFETEEKLRKINNQIEDYIENPTLVLSEDFIALYSMAKTLENQLKIYEEIKTKYV